MIALKTVLCPVDFSAATPRQVDLAAELSRTFGARLVLHHNRHSLGAVASVGWMWNADHQATARPSWKPNSATASRVCRRVSAPSR